MSGSQNYLNQSIDIPKMAEDQSYHFQFAHENPVKSLYTYMTMCSILNNKPKC